MRQVHGNFKLNLMAIKSLKIKYNLTDLNVNLGFITIVVHESPVTMKFKGLNSEPIRKSLQWSLQ